MTKDLGRSDLSVPVRSRVCILGHLGSLYHIYYAKNMASRWMHEVLLTHQIFPISMYSLYTEVVSGRLLGHHSIATETFQVSILTSLYVYDYLNSTSLCIFEIHGIFQ